MHIPDAISDLSCYLRLFIFLQYESLSFPCVTVSLSPMSTNFPISRCRVLNMWSFKLRSSRAHTSRPSPECAGCHHRNLHPLSLAASGNITESDLEQIHLFVSENKVNIGTEKTKHHFIIIHQISGCIWKSENRNVFLMPLCSLRDLYMYISLIDYKTNKISVRPAKTLISLDIRPVWSVFAVHSMGS